MKVMKVAPTDKLVEFAKKEANIKEFHQDHPVSELLRSEMVKVHRDFERYMQEMYFDEIKSLLKEFIDEHHPREEKRKSLEHNLIWWKILYDSSEEEWSCTDDYIDENYHCFIDKDAITSWLREWDQVSTRFYFVGHKYNDRNFFVIDIFDEKMLNVVVLDPKAAPPKEGEIVIGTLIPYGDGVYSPITDFYCFDYEAREAMGATFRFYYDKYLKANSLSASFVHVLSIMLHIERRIHQKILRVK